MANRVFFENEKGTITVMCDGKELYKVSNLEHNKKGLISQGCSELRKDEVSNYIKNKTHTL